MKSEPIILTRYLYIKSKVTVALVNAILQKDEEQALFWGYELYYSGFEKETVDILVDAYENFYNEDKKLGKFLESKKKDWDKSPSPNIVAIFIKNMVIRNINIFTPIKTKKSLLITVNDDQIEKYKTNETQPKKWKILREQCIYSLIRDKVDKRTETKLLHVFRDQWLFYASYSPVWENRIKTYQGKIDKRKKIVTFSNEDLEEEFSDKYNYEPDEQPLDIQKRCLGIE